MARVHENGLRLLPSQRELEHVRLEGQEPLLGPLRCLDLDRIDWVIVGGESGPGARPMDAEWVLGIRDQCRRAQVPIFFKQWGGVNKKSAGRELQGRTWDEMPEVPVGAWGQVPPGGGTSPPGSLEGFEPLTMPYGTGRDAEKRQELTGPALRLSPPGCRPRSTATMSLARPPVDPRIEPRRHRQGGPMKRAFAVSWVMALLPRTRQLNIAWASLGRRECLDVVRRLVGTVAGARC